MRIVLDSNVLLAAFGTRGLCETVLQVSLAAHDLVISDYILDEVARNLTRKFGIAAENVEEIVRYLREESELVKPEKVSAPNVESDDLPVLGTALSGCAHCLITGDQSLLKLKRFKRTSILSPRKFYESLR